MEISINHYFYSLFECNFYWQLKTLGKTQELSSVFQKVIWVWCIWLKLTLSYGKLNANFGKFNFLGKAKLRNLEIYRLEKFLTLIQHNFPNTFQGYVHTFELYIVIRLLVWDEPKIFPCKCFFFLIKSITRSFMLNTMMGNKNKHFTDISIPFLILSIVKLISQINILFSLYWRHLSEIHK